VRGEPIEHFVDGERLHLVVQRGGDLQLSHIDMFRPPPRFSRACAAPTRQESAASPRRPRQRNAPGSRIAPLRRPTKRSQASCTSAVDARCVPELHGPFDTPPAFGVRHKRAAAIHPQLSRRAINGVKDLGNVAHVWQLPARIGSPRRSSGWLGGMSTILSSSLSLLHGQSYVNSAKQGFDMPMRNTCEIPPTFLTQPGKPLM